MSEMTVKVLIKKLFIIALVFLSVSLFSVSPALAQDPTPTPEPTPTPSPTPAYQVYTQTLSSGDVLVIERRATYGEQAVGGLLIFTCVLLVLNILITAVKGVA